MREQRATPRLKVQAEARLQALGESSDKNGVPVRATVVDSSDGGIRLQTKVAMSSGRAVTVEVAEAMFLGEVCYCAPAAEDGNFYLGIHLRECLTGLASLQHLIHALRPEPAAELLQRR